MNILHFNVTPKDIDSVWKVVKQVRQLFLFKSASSVCSGPSLLNNNDTISNTMKFEEKLNLTTPDDIFENVTESTLETAGEIFLYLNSCPPPILNLYSELFKNGTSREIILALTSIIKSSHKRDRDVARKIWSKITDEMRLTCKLIERSTNEIPKNISEDNVDDKYGADTIFKKSSQSHILEY